MTVPRGCFLAWAVLMGACVLPKRPPPAPPRHTDLGLQISSVTLANGLPVVLVRDPNATEVQVTMRYKVGAGDDLEYPGMAHLVEHLMFQQVLGAQTLFAHLEDSATFFTGFTTFDATTYISRAKPDQLDKLLSIEAVRLGFRCTSISDSAFVRERDVVTQEAKLRDESTEIVTALHSAVYPVGHPYRQAIGGSVEGIKTITREQACKFADAYYATNNAALVISGNLSNEQVETALGKFLARVSKRVAASPATVPAAKALGRLEARAPIDDTALLVAWPLTRNPEDEIGVRALAGILAYVVDRSITGRVAALQLGDVRAPMIGIAIVPGKDESVDDVLDKVREVLSELPLALDTPIVKRSRVFDQLQQRSIYAQYASLEDGSMRDVQLASYVLAGNDPASALAAEFRGLRALQGKNMATLVRDHFDIEHASIVTLKPADGKKRGRAIELPSTTVTTATTHDMGQRRNIPDPAAAHSPATAALPAAPNGVQTRVLPNGLKVVLLPLSTVPTVDARLVFAAGTADEPADRRGTALVAARGLGWDIHHINDLWNFNLSGGSTDVDVDSDHTVFTVQGVDMHLDYLLAGLRRWVRDGTYDDADTIVEALQRESKKVDDLGVVTDAWRAAVFGEQHPYVRAGLVRYATSNLSVADAEAYRRAYYTPDNATLVIAGRFDAALANRWIDFLFEDWQGTAKPRSARATTLQAASLAKAEDLTQMLLLVAIPARAGTRAQQLVAAEMLSDIAHDVRHQLAASYTFEATLDESRLAKNFLVIGWIDPDRSTEVVQLLRDRLATLRSDPDIAARAFVIARNRVLTKLGSIAGGATSLAIQVERDVELGRAPLSDLATASDVRTLTIEQMTPTLADLDLTQAAILMRGPDDGVKNAFAALGRTPAFVRFDQAAQDAIEDAPAPTSTQRQRKRDVVMFSDFETSLTEQGPPSPFLVSATLGYGWGNVTGLNQPMAIVREFEPATGLIGTAAFGYRFTARYTLGLQLSIGSLAGTEPITPFESKPYGLIPIDASVFIQTMGYDRLWGGVLLGVHIDGTRIDGDTAWQTGACLGVEGGVDVLKLGAHHLGGFLRFTGSLGTDTGYGSISFGLAYRH